MYPNTSSVSAAAIRIGESSKDSARAITAEARIEDFDSAAAAASDSKGLAVKAKTEEIARASDFAIEAIRETEIVAAGRLDFTAVIVVVVATETIEDSVAGFTEVIVAKGSKIEEIDSKAIVKDSEEIGVTAESSMGSIAATETEESSKAV